MHFMRIRVCVRARTRNERESEHIQKIRYEHTHTHIIYPRILKQYARQNQAHIRLPRLLRQYLYFCTSAFCVSICTLVASVFVLLSGGIRLQRLSRRYLYFCTSKASKQSTKRRMFTGIARDIEALKRVSICTFVPVTQVNRAPARATGIERAIEALKRKHMYARARLSILRSLLALLVVYLLYW
jgi:hypothetical protein